LVVPVTVDASAASSHRTHPGIVGGTSTPEGEVKIEIICEPLGKKTDGWFVVVLDLIMGGRENTGTDDGNGI
jgi:hypothetical protein